MTILGTPTRSSWQIRLAWMGHPGLTAHAFRLDDVGRPKPALCGATPDKDDVEAIGRWRRTGTFQPCPDCFWKAERKRVEIAPVASSEIT